ncbi:MAG TPA: HEAT repeat domain-containing protein [Blastocatellia bacterium]|nr:HEAT repeat domain-containing protein [Blastocatellia bacterium]
MFLEGFGKKTVLGSVRLVILLVLFAVVVASSAQERQMTHPTSEALPRKRVSTIIRDINSRGHHEVDGLKVWTRSLPSNEELDEVRGYGEAAVPVLTDYLKSEDAHERELAMRFLGQLGGSQIVEPLRMVLLSDTSPGVRQSALHWLTLAPWDLASPIIERSAASDVDQRVRDAAKGILASHARK